MSPCSRDVRGYRRTETESVTFVVRSSSLRTPRAARPRLPARRRSRAAFPSGAASRGTAPGTRCSAGSPRDAPRSARGRGARVSPPGTRSRARLSPDRRAASCCAARSSFFSKVALERGPHLRPRAVQENTLVRLGELENVTDLFGAPALDVAQLDHLPLLLGQPRDRPFDHLAGLAVEH